MEKLHIILKWLKPIVPIAAVALLTSKLDLVLSSRRDVNFLKKLYHVLYIYICIIALFKKKYAVLNTKIKSLPENGCFGYIPELVEMTLLVRRV